MSAKVRVKQWRMVCAWQYVCSLAVKGMSQKHSEHMKRYVTSGLSEHSKVVFKLETSGIRYVHHLVSD